MQNAVFTASGIDCASCVSRLSDRIKNIPGIASADISYMTSQIQISYDETQTNIAELARNIEKNGCRILPGTAVLSCPSLSASTEKTVHSILQAFPYFRDAVFDNEKHIITVSLWTDDCNPEYIAEKLSASGFKTEITEITGGCEDYEQQKQLLLLRLVVFSFFASAPILWNPSPFFQFILATVVQFGPGMYFYRGVIDSFRKKSASMDCLIALSTSAVYAYSTYIVFTQVTDIKLYYLSSCVLICLILLGKYLELAVKGETSRSISSLLHLQPQKAVIIKAGVQKEVSVDEIHTGDCVLIRSGERIPVDGIITEGNCAVDESAITGESIPVAKKKGDMVTGGTLNRSGYIAVHTERTGKDSRLQQIISIVQKAQLSRAPVQDFTDRIASVFIPSVTVIAAVVFCIWYFIISPYDTGQAISIVCGILVVACPCALGLATPASIMVGTGRAAELGIIFRNASVLENARKIDTVVLDKTGTLTSGQLHVTGIETYSTLSEAEVLQAAASAGQYSAHPVIQAAVHLAQERSLVLSDAEPESVHEYAGEGIETVINGNTILCGSRKFMLSRHITCSTDIINTYSSEIYIACNTVLTGRITTVDTVRPDAAHAVQELKDQGIQVWLITGDNSRAAAAAAAETGIENVLSSMMPEEKAQKIKEMCAKGKHVAMTGDGINDAPALTLGDIGIAMGSASAVASDAAGIILPGNSLEAVPRAFRISDITVKNIRQNLGWALLYNAVFIPLASCGIINPSVASAAMSFSSIFVLMHALRLKKAEKKEQDTYGKCFI